MGRGSERSDRGAAHRELAAARTQIAAARARLVLERPFLGELALHLEPLPRGGEARFATDGRHLFFAPDIVCAMPSSELQFALAHQVLHLALGHFARRGHRVARLWNLACDYAVNQLLVDDGMPLPRGALLNSAFHGLAAEEIYPLLAADAAGETLDSHGLSVPSGAEQAAIREARLVDTAHADSAFSDVRRESVGEFGAAGFEERWRQRLTSSAMATARAGRLNPHWQRVLGDEARPRLPWRALLARFFSGIAREDYGYERPNRRQEGGALFPGRVGRRPEVVVALDTSGSIGRGELEEFLDEVDALHGELRTRIVLTACDAELEPQAPWRFEPWERIQLPVWLGGGGGTRFTPVFEWLRSAALRPDALLYFTDALGEFPPQAPEYPVLWIVKGRGDVPWGERVQLN